MKSKSFLSRCLMVTNYFLAMEAKKLEAKGLELIVVRLLNLKASHTESTLD